MLKGDDLYVERLQTSGSCPTNKEKKKEKDRLRGEKEGLIFGLWRRIRSSTKSRVTKTRFVVRCEG